MAIAADPLPPPAGLNASDLRSMAATATKHGSRRLGRACGKNSFATNIWSRANDGDQRKGTAPPGSAHLTGLLLQIYGQGPGLLQLYGQGPRRLQNHGSRRPGRASSINSSNSDAWSDPAHTARVFCYRFTVKGHDGYKITVAATPGGPAA